jgi:ATP-dependent Clp protease ATP-binding subunit ClpB
MHTLVGAGKADGAMDASNLLKPALARGELHCVGATTLDEYRKHVEKDAALARRFQPVMVRSRRWRTRSPSCAASRRSTSCTTACASRRGAGGGGDAVQPLHHRPVPAGQGHRPDGRGVVASAHGGGQQARGTRRARPPRSCRSRSRREALKKETDKASKDRLEKLEKELSELQQKSAEMTAQWQAERDKLADRRALKEQLDRRARSWIRPSARATSPRPGSCLRRHPAA